jgi:hypothetical protein
MSSFVRFIFFVLVAGIILNLVIVGVANVNSERHREIKIQEERDAFARLLKTINGRLRAAHIAVESNADAMSAFVSFVMVRLSQKSARSGAKYRNIVEIVVELKNWFGYPPVSDHRSGQPR